jgi:hypothetical protein
MGNIPPHVPSHLRPWRDQATKVLYAVFLIASVALVLLAVVVGDDNHEWKKRLSDVTNQANWLYFRLTGHMIVY